MTLVILERGKGGDKTVSARVPTTERRRRRACSSSCCLFTVGAAMTQSDGSDSPGYPIMRAVAPYDG